MTDRESLDARWQAQQDATAVGESPPVDATPADATDLGAGDPRWDAEADFYAALADEGRAAALAPDDLACIETALLADAQAAAGVSTGADADAEADTGVRAADGDPDRSDEASRAGTVRRLAAALAVAAALALVWWGWPSQQIAAITQGSWVAQASGTAHGNGDALPQAIWLVAGPDACGTIGEATLCATEGTVVRIEVGAQGTRPRVEVERGEVTVREGAWTVLTPQGEQTLRVGESLRVEAPVVAQGGVAPDAPRPDAAARPEDAPAESADEASAPDLSEDLSEDLPEDLLEDLPEEPAQDATADPGAPPRDRTKTTTAPAEEPAAMLAKARSLRGAGQTAKATKAFGAVIKAHPDRSEANVARVSLGQIRLGAGRNGAALGLFNGYLRRGGPLAEEALWGKIQALDALGRDAALGEAVQTLERRFPRSVYRDRAKEKLTP